jgi:hypothetical protein
MKFKVPVGHEVATPDQLVPLQKAEPRCNAPNLGATLGLPKR